MMVIQNYNQYLDSFQSQQASTNPSTSLGSYGQQPTRRSFGFPPTKEAQPTTPRNNADDYADFRTKFSQNNPYSTPVSRDIFDQMRQGRDDRKAEEVERADRFSGQDIAERGLTDDFEERKRGQALRRWFRDQGLSTVSDFIGEGGPVEGYRKDVKGLAAEGKDRVAEMEQQELSDLEQVRPALNKFVDDAEERKTDSINYGQKIADDAMAHIQDWATQDLVLSGTAMWQDTQERIRQGRAAMTGQASEAEIDAWEGRQLGQARQKAGLITAQIKSGYLKARAETATQLGGYLMENGRWAAYTESGDRQYALGKEVELAKMKIDLGHYIEGLNKEYTMLEAQAHQHALAALSHGYDNMFYAFSDADAFLDPMEADSMVWANEISEMYGPPLRVSGGSSSSNADYSYPTSPGRPTSINDVYRNRPYIPRSSGGGGGQQTTTPATPPPAPAAVPAAPAPPGGSPGGWQPLNPYSEV